MQYPYFSIVPVKHFTLISFTFELSFFVVVYAVNTNFITRIEFTKSVLVWYVFWML